MSFSLPVSILWCPSWRDRRINEKTWSVTGKWLQEDPEITKGLFICQHQKAGLAILTALKSLWEDFYDIRPPGANAGDGGGLLRTGLHGLVLLPLIFLGAWASVTQDHAFSKFTSMVTKAGNCMVFTDRLITYIWLYVWWHWPWLWVPGALGQGKIFQTLWCQALAHLHPHIHVHTHTHTPGKHIHFSLHRIFSSHNIWLYFYINIILFDINIYIFIFYV